MGLLYVLVALGAGLGVFALASRASGSTQGPAEAEPPPGEQLPGEPPAAGSPADAVAPEGLGRSREHGAADDSSAAEIGPSSPIATGQRVPPPALGEWAALLAPGCVRIGVQLPYVLKWIDLESGGNPCEVGYPPAHGPGGFPREMGIAQFYNPDDLVRLQLSSKALRAYCVPGDQHEILYRGKIVRGFSRELSRPLTSDEMREQATGTLGLIASSMSEARTDLRRVGAGPAWSPGHRSYWALVKLQHGLPAISRQGLPAVTKQLGRPPHDWPEFARGLAGVKLSDEVEAKYRHLFPGILENATRCAEAFSEKAVA